MKKKIIAVLLAASFCGSVFAGCGDSSSSVSEDVQTISASDAENEESTETEDTAEVTEAADESAEDTETAGEDNTSEDTEETDETAEAASEDVPEDGVYQASFLTDSSMFHVNEAYDDKGTLTVENGKMTIHITLVSENIVNLFVGTKEDAQKDGAELLQPTVDDVTYDDGYEEECYGFDVPVPYLDKEFDLALIGTEGKWYDHKVQVTDVAPLEEEN